MKISTKLICTTALMGCLASGGAWAANAGFIRGVGAMPPQCLDQNHFCVLVSNLTTQKDTEQDPSVIPAGVKISVGMTGTGCSTMTWSAAVGAGGYLWASKECMATAVTVVSDPSGTVPFTSIPLPSKVGPMKIMAVPIFIGGTAAAPHFKSTPEALR